MVNFTANCFTYYSELVNKISSIESVDLEIKKTSLKECLFLQTGDVLLSQAAARQVSSALKSLTTVFEMGTGVTSSL